MANTTDSRRSRRASAKARRQRIDLPHPAASTKTAAPDVPITGQLPESQASTQSLHAAAPDTRNKTSPDPSPEDQAAELAELLYARQKELDRREATLNARQTEFDNEVCTARLWLEEHHHDLTQREETLSQREEELASLPSATELSGRESKLNQTKEDVELCRRELDQQAVALDHQREALALQHQEYQAEAEKLEARHRDLDERQAHLYNDIEQFTSDQVRLADRQQVAEDRKNALNELTDDLHGRETEIAVREDQLTRQKQRLTQKANELDSTRMDVECLMREQEERAADLDDRNGQLIFRAREIEAAIARYERLGVTEQRMRELQEESGELETRRIYLDRAESLFAEEQAELTAARQDLDAQRRQLTQDLDQERRQLASQRSETEAEHIRRQQRLETREKEADVRETALEQLQVELSQSQREVFEMRLATEEIYSQLSGALAPASLSRSIAQTRGKLADQYRLHEGRLARHEGELQTARHDLAAEHVQLLAQRNELDVWLRQRQQDIEQQAARLIAREQELDRQDAHFADQQRQWDEERQAYQQEIRRLLGALRKPSACAA